MVVLEDGAAFRYRQKSEARTHVATMRRAGVRAHLRRWGRDRARYVWLGFEVTHPRWMP
jgi:hypothetical protein